ncbi:hypothetical protein FNW02_36200 [Komarekiella sp. 'clone 1']|uniref:Uncharacterized protein n=1 Tax=Komarekiella delphini-convector SJRDD-AB1 TaxID=2593771 RepID=A0AA41BA64_9NOST|nr:hypothetical protein [Komarekiella delphini-convector]MBD6621024.1 hypothetical protein [Komarekiella delphini-convector SJRDD-AB1]
MDIALRVFRHNQYQELLQASDVMENDLTDLVCQCVECGNFVIWVAPNSKEALRKRSAHFRHPRNVNNKLVMYCEKRVSTYSSAKVNNLRRSIAEARCRYIRKEFWKLMSNYYLESCNFRMNDILSSADPKYREMGELFATGFRKEEDYTPQLFQIINCIFSGVPVWLTHAYLGDKRRIMPNPSIQKHFMEQVTGQLNQKLHYLICLDVLRFIKESKSSWEICIRLFTLAAYSMVEYLYQGMLLGLEAEDGTELVIYEKAESGSQKLISRDLSFWENNKNKQIIYNYTVAHVLTWVALIPYNQTIEKG